MKSVITVLAILGFTTTAGFGQGLVNFANSQSTLISAGGTAMPGANTSQFIFAVFLAPSDTVATSGQAVSFKDPRFQFVGAYNTNHPAAIGRLISLNNVALHDWNPGSTVDFVVRGWSVNAGTNWSQALETWNDGVPFFPSIYIGSSTVGNDLVLGGGSFTNATLFGPGSAQVGGFNMPEVFGCIGPYLSIHQRLYDHAVIEGGTTNFHSTVWACPDSGLTAQWHFNGSLLAGQTRGKLVITNAQPSDAGTYTVVWNSSWWGGAGHLSVTDVAVLTVVVPPRITSGPVSQTAEIGAKVHLTMRATGDSPLVYHWLLNGTNVLGDATNSVLELDNVGPAQSGSYTVVVTNAVGAVTSAPAMLNVIAPIERRMVPGVALSAQLAVPSHLEYSEAIGPTRSWSNLAVVDLTESPDFYFDLDTPLPSQRFYRAWQTTTPTNPPSLNLHMIPALTLTGSPGNQIRVGGINQFGPTDAWFMLATVTLTNTSQLYFDVTAPSQPARLYRLVPVP